MLASVLLMGGTWLPKATLSFGLDSIDKQQRRKAKRAEAGTSIVILALQNLVRDLPPTAIQVLTHCSSTAGKAHRDHWTGHQTSSWTQNSRPATQKRSSRRFSSSVMFRRRKVQHATDQRTTIAVATQSLAKACNAGSMVYGARRDALGCPAAGVGGYASGKPRETGV